MANAALAMGLLACTALYLWPPTQLSLYPACPFRELLHLDCPGCGATRALAALLHGRLQEAMRLNALFVLLLPIALTGAVECYRRAIRMGQFRWPMVPAPALYGTIAATAMFTVVRNMVR
jgi:hypothetical protein